jgi:hypothetical protein
MYNIETITNAVAQMNMEEKQVLFHLVSTHAELFNKIVPGLPLVIHALGQETLKHPLAEQYDAWLNAKTAAASAG